MSLQFNPFTGTFDVTTKGDTGTVAAAGDGTAAAPGITFASDTNTGIYRPGVDQLALSTNGTGRLFVDAGGNIGVGMTPVDVAGFNSVQLSDSNGTYLDFYTGATQQARIISLPNDFRINQITSGTLGLWTNNTERLRITSTGLVGIGTSAPNRRLEISDLNADNFIRVNTSGAFKSGIEFSNLGTAFGQLYFNNVAPYDLSLLQQYTTGSLILGTNNTERARIDSSGRLGIGTVSPDSKISIGGTGANRISFSGSTGQQYVGFDASEDVLQVASNTAIKFQTSSSYTERARIDSSGRLGIGVTDPGSYNSAAANLVIGSTTANTGLTIRSGATGVADRAGSIYFADGTTGNEAFRGFIDYTHSIDALGIGTSGLTRLVIDSSGRLLVGTSSSIGGSTLQVAGTGGNTLEVSRFSASSAGPFINAYKSRGATVGVNTAVIQDDLLGAWQFLGADGTGYQPAANIRAFVDPGTVSGTSMPGRLVFSTTADGAASPTERLRITNDGVFGYNQPAPVAVDTTATLTVVNLKTGIITSSTAAAVTMTLPTGTLTEGGFSGLYNNFTFEWTVINTGATNAVTVQGDTGHTLVGSGTVAAGVSGRFASRRTAANTFVTYRLS